MAADYTFLPALPVTNAQSLPLLDITQCGSRMLAVGERGLAIYSENGGESWVQANVPVSQTLTAVYCLPSGKAWAVGHSGVILGSDDAGSSWTLQLDGHAANQQWLDYNRQQQSALESELAGAAAQNAEDLEYALEDAIFAIEDAEAAIATGPADPFLDIWFRDEQHGLAVGAYGMIYRSQNGGASWQISVAGIDNPDRYHYYSIAAANNGSLFLSGEAGLLYRSRDEGLSWELLDAGYDGSFFGLVVTAGQSVLAFGLRGNILLSEDDGESWQSSAVENNPHLSLYGGSRLADGSLSLVGAGGVILTSVDNGVNFKSKIMSGRSTLSSVAGEDPKSALAVGMGGLESPERAAP